MRNILIAGLAAATLFPSAAFAQQTCEQQRSDRTVGTVAGAGVGAVAGGAIAGRGDRATGAVIGGVAGAIIGNQLAKGSADCSRAYGYYDKNGLWHATGAGRGDVQGYYDRDGDWVAGPPNGYYDGQGRWVRAADTSANGYYDANNQWVPASASGYYAANGEWIAGAASGYYTSDGRWIAGPATGRYDADGRWMPGQPNGRRDANGVWVADAQPGYYDSNRRWRAGPAVGYYDNQGRWIATADSASYNSANAAYDSRSGPPDQRDFKTRVARLDDRIRRGMSDGSLTPRQGSRALRELRSIQREEAQMPHRYGQLSPRYEARIQARLDSFSASLRQSRQDNDRSY